jgi:uncharacterized protein (TIGR00251 family)
MSPVTSRGTAEPTLVRVRVQPRATRDEIVGWRADTLGVRVTAPPVDGRANAAVAALVASALRIPSSAVQVVRGERGRDKWLRVAGLSPGDVRKRLGQGGA